MSPAGKSDLQVQFQVETIGRSSVTPEASLRSKRLIGLKYSIADGLAQGYHFPRIFVQEKRPSSSYGPDAVLWILFDFTYWYYAVDKIELKVV